MNTKFVRSKFNLLIIFYLALLILASGTFYFKYASKPETNVVKPVLASSQVLAKQKKQFALPILIYHYVEIVKNPKDTIRKSLNIQPQAFEQQIKTIQNAGYTFITPSQIQGIESGQLKIDKPIILTFDDGYSDFYTDVFPILKKYNVRVATYIVPGFLDHPNYMSWQEVKEISKSNLVEIGAHTENHVVLAKLAASDATTQIVQSKRILEEQLGIKIATFAYPYGSFNDQIIKIVETAGFTSAMTEIPGPNQNEEQPFLLRRIHPGTAVGTALVYRLEH